MQQYLTHSKRTTTVASKKVHRSVLLPTYGPRSFFLHHALCKFITHDKPLCVTLNLGLWSRLGKTKRWVGKVSCNSNEEIVLTLLSSFPTWRVGILGISNIWDKIVSSKYILSKLGPQYHWKDLDVWIFKMGPHFPFRVMSFGLAFYCNLENQQVFKFFDTTWQT